MTSTTRVRPLRSDVREQIVVAAGAEFSERGYAGTSVAQVAARAGFTKGAVYSNFGGKPELFAAAMQAYSAGAVVG
ncbi:MAG: TetR family transcriptional regulator, partial [Propionibacteriaceae bacterium]